MYAYGCMHSHAYACLCIYACIHARLALLSIYPKP